MFDFLSQKFSGVLGWLKDRGRLTAENIDEALTQVKDALIDADVSVSITRNYGETAAEKSNELLLHMGIAVVGVMVLIWLTLGWRESGIVGVAIPATLALTLLVFYLYGRRDGRPPG